MEWIEINLPWSYHDFEILKMDEQQKAIVDARGKEKFGHTLDEMYEDSDEATIMNMPNDGFYTLDHEAQDKRINEYIAEHPKQFTRKQYRAFVNTWRKWYNKQPEVIEHEKKNDELQETKAQKSFCGRGLNKAGTLIEVEQDSVMKQFLIGDINESRGVCDDCCEFNGDTIVKRYKVIWEKE